MHWSPYEDNGGTTIAIAGKDFVIVGADTRMSRYDGGSIVSRSMSKMFQPTLSSVVLTAGMQADRIAFFKRIECDLQWYSFNNQGKIPPVTSLHRLLSVMLYHQRFSPLYCFTTLAGLDENGVGQVYSYDIFGSTEPVTHVVNGTGTQLIEPFLDSVVVQRNLAVKMPDLKLDDAVEVVRAAFAAVAERDTCTGDTLEILSLSAAGPTRLTFPLRHD